MIDRFRTVASCRKEISFDIAANPSRKLACWKQTNSQTNRLAVGQNKFPTIFKHAELTFIVQWFYKYMQLATCNSEKNRRIREAL